jgi:hypothetical protein
LRTRSSYTHAQGRVMGPGAPRVGTDLSEDLSASVGIGREAAASTRERTATPSTRRITGAARVNLAIVPRRADWPDAPHGAQADGAPG